MNLTTKEGQKEFYREYIKNCLDCGECPITNYCANSKNDLNTCCWNIFQNWLRDSMLMEYQQEAVKEILEK